MQTNIFIGTADGIHRIGDDGSVALAGREVTWLVVDTTGSWAIIDGRELWRSDDDGDWSHVASAEGLRANCGLPVGDELYVGTSEAHMLTLRGGALERVQEFDDAPERESWYTPWGGPPDVRSMSLDPKGTVYANVHVGGVVRSAVGGGSWSPTIDIHSDVHQVLFDADSRLVLAASARGLAVSADAGESWRLDRDGLHASYSRAVAVAGDTVVVSASTGPSTSRAAVYRKPVSNEGPFEQCTSGLPEWFPGNIDTHCLAASDAAVAFGASDGRVFLSRDQGETWSTMAEGLPSIRCVVLG